jgi:glycosyltransferase involved in cell wall biosynthesis
LALAFFALLPVRDEADIIGQCLRYAVTWADAIYVFDSGSVDETWEIVLDYASREKRIKPVRRQPVYFSETRLRGFLFHHARQFMRDGDWFVRLDADEFHHISPPEFVRNRLRQCETIAYHQYYNFCLTESEVEAWIRGEETPADRSRPIEERRRFFTPSVYSEPRLCRYRSSMRWPETVSFPFNAGFVARERLPIRHYPHRDPVQLERRCRLRAIMIADPRNRSNWAGVKSHHWEESEWRKFVTPDNAEGLYCWSRGEELPKVHFNSHLMPSPVRFVQRSIHALLLPILDRTRSSFPGEEVLQPIPEDIQRRLMLELRTRCRGAQG